MTQDNPVTPENPDDAIGALPPDLRPLPAVLAVVGGVVSAVAVWALTNYVLHTQVVPQLLPGVIVGCLVRFGAGGARHPMIWVVMGCALAGHIAGFI